LKKIAFYIFYVLNWIFTLLPLGILYIFSDILYLLMYYFPTYRRKVVRSNLKNSFPEKSDKELVEIEKKFYRHLSDIFIETLKMTHLSNSALKKRFSCSNPELFDSLFKSDRDLVVVHSHFNNWEWLTCLPFYTEYKVVSIYKPLHDKLFDRFLNKNRTKTNLTLTPMNSVVREIVSNRNNRIRAMYGFIADQTPARPDIHYWTQFLNQETPVFLGIEKIAVKYEMPVVFFNVQKIRRGYYSLTVELLFDKPSGMPEHLITDTHVRRLEALIKENPQYWIWTHKRWKHKKEQV
jgi:KDO2-lipid IV(A) lauroyltransferase